MSVKGAIAFIEKCRGTHEQWIVFLTKHPDWPNQDQIGDLTHHEEISEKYGQVLALLRVL